MAEVINTIRKQLIENADEKTRESGRRYFKEEIQLYGVKTAIVTQIGNQAFKLIKAMPKSEVFALCEDLWKSGMMEESFIACNWTYSIRKQYAPEDFAMFEAWVNKYVSNWAACDSLCNHSIGSFLEQYPSFVEDIKEWTFSKNRWVKRASAVSFILPARKGLFKKDIFEIADNLLLDTDDMVQKGYGWMLKSLADACEDEVFQYVLDHRASMPRTALRYAIEKMPDEKKREAMKRV
ncbi:MAG TPA: DNA alkylation repair protein [Anaerolineaceae bacterium]|jgi:3-methyladenine DNA glycosylase AlkD|nr:DNA alkylation repair protein [Anaerolineaceae bacterium]